MSESGQTRRSGDQPFTSGQPLWTDLVGAGRNAADLPCFFGPRL